MAAITYPSNLPKFQREKGRQDAQSFQNTDVAAGAPFSQIITEDLTSTWDARLVLSSGQAVAFKAWLNTGATAADKPINGAFFNMDILIENGLETQEVRFLTVPQLQRVQGDVFIYSMTVLTRQINDGFTEDDLEYILELAEISPCGDIKAGVSLVDIAVNVDLN